MVPRLCKRAKALMRGARTGLRQNTLRNLGYIGGGNVAQSAAGQIVGWTIEYHGGTQIKQNWYATPTEGEPFLIEPVLGE